MKRLPWALAVVRNLDAVLGLLIAVTIAVLGIADQVKPDTVSNAILLVLALLAQSVLRDRQRVAGLERSLRSAGEVVSGLPARMSRMDDVSRLVTEARQAIDDANGLQVISGAEVGLALARAREQTDRWHFKGGTGTYLRARTLPDCFERARRRNGTLDLRIEILDPTDAELCQTYADFRTSLGDGPDPTGEPWTADRTVKESFATLLACCWYRQQSGLLHVEVYLSPVMTTYRYDLSSTCVVITQQDARIPALKADNDRVFYHRWNVELQFSRAQARRVDLDRARRLRLDDEPSVDQVRRLFDLLEVPLPRSFGDREVAEVVQKAIRPVNPYEP